MQGKKQIITISTKFSHLKELIQAKFGKRQRTHGQRYVPNFVSVGLFSHSKTINFAVLTSAFCGVANWRRTEKVKHGCTLHIYRPSPILRYQNHFCIPMPSWRNYVHKLLSFKCVTDTQTNRKQCLGAAGEIRGPPLGMVVEELEHVPAPLKHFGV